MSARHILASLALVVTVLLASGCEDEFATDCEAQGGKIDKSTKTGVGNGVDAKGRPIVVTTTTTTRYCIVDGRIAAVD